MRVLITADLHYNHPKSRAPAEALIDDMNRAGGDVLIIAGDTSVADDDSMERCLSRFDFAGEKLFLAGNHELWTLHDDSMRIFIHDLPQRVRELGWRWLQDEPMVLDGVGIV